MNKAGLQATTYCLFTSSIVILVAGLIRMLLHQDGILHLEYGGVLLLIAGLMRSSERKSTAWNDDRDSLLSFLIALVGWFMVMGGVWHLFWGTLAGAVGWEWQSAILEGSVRVVIGVMVVRIGRWFVGSDN